ncbi:biotin/lipoyl-containing protein [Pseudoalteromonas sp. SSDWG2]|uniref:biotin/lipoyl-containing protein n=1 Tax=Pseudoalteromonas sp. SSDWG2 TaxID=3139391 RepID=UPI003BA919CD
MREEIKIPSLPEQGSSASINKVYVNEGQIVTFEQILFAVESDKVILEVVAPCDGIIEQILIAQGEVVTPEQVAMRLRQHQVSAAQAQRIHMTNVEKDTQKVANKELDDRFLLDNPRLLWIIVCLFIGITLLAILTLS